MIVLKEYPIVTTQNNYDRTRGEGGYCYYIMADNILVGWLVGCEDR